MRDPIKTITLATSLLSIMSCEAFTDPGEVPRPVCRGAQDCDDGLFCNGAEACDPQAEGADSFGCVSPAEGALLDDGVECTIDLCDEASRRIDHDPSACECVADAQCAAINPSPCVEAICDLSAFACRVTPRTAGDPCDDGISCTPESSCDDAGDCVGQPDDGACDDGLFCNGAEACAPGAEGADPLTGCAAGLPRAEDPQQNDGIECTATLCDEEEDVVEHTPTADCGCQSPEDCSDGTCQAFACDSDTGFTCQPIPDERLPGGSGCDDGLACTTGDTCGLDGDCAGEAVNTFCSNGDPCDGEELCVPQGEGVDEEGCAPGVPPVVLPEGCE